MSREQFLWGLSTGSLICGIAGALWFGLALGPSAASVGAAVLPAIIGIQVIAAIGSGHAGLKLRPFFYLPRGCGTRHDAAVPLRAFPNLPVQP